MSAQRPQLVFLVGPAAVGKMTVGRELQDRTGLRLLHNHMTIDLVAPFFPFGSEQFGRLVHQFRTAIVREVADSELPGLLFTFVWAFDVSEDDRTIADYAAPFVERGLRVSYVELQASPEERLRRNRTPLRLEHKPSKRDLEWSDDNLRSMDADYVLTAPAELRAREDWYHLDTTDLTAEQTAEQVMERLRLPRLDQA